MATAAQIIRNHASGNVLLQLSTVSVGQNSPVRARAWLQLVSTPELTPLDNKIAAIIGAASVCGIVSEDGMACLEVVGCSLTQSCGYSDTP